MAHDHDHHEDLIDSLTNEYQALLDNSKQGIYIYLDDANKVCNKLFATFLGYSSEKEWASVTTSFPEAFVDDASQSTLVSAYQDAMEHGIGSANEITWRKKDGKNVRSNVILVPIMYDGHLFALHFVTKSR